MDEFCKCVKPDWRYETKSEQHGGVIREVIIGEYCDNCGKPKPPKEEVDEN